MMDVTKPYDSHFKMYVSQIIMLYSLNLYSAFMSVISQLKLE